MRTISRLLLLLTLITAFAISLVAQTTAQAQEPAALNITIGEQRLKFAPTRQFQQMRLSVFNHQGELVYGTATNEAELLWPIKTNNGEVLTPGLYSYVMTLKYGDNDERQHKGHFVIERGQDQMWLTTKDRNDEISGASLTASRVEGRVWAGTREDQRRGLGDRAMDSQTASDKNAGKTANVKSEKAELLGTSNRIVKFDGSGNPTEDSIMVENGAQIDLTGSMNVTGSYKIGNQNGLNVKGAQQSVFIGPGAGAVATGLNNIHIGTSAGTNTTTGTNNTFIGTAAGQGNTTGVQNNAIGTQAGASLMNGNNNTFIGNQAGFSTTSGINNMMIGTFAGFTNSTASNNTFIGLSAGQNSNGQSNTFIGVNAGVNTTSGGENMFIGVGAGSTNVNGTRNLLIGTNTKVGSPGLTNAGALGYAAQVDASNSLVLGSINGVNGATADTYVGIGTTTPARSLEIASGKLRFSNPNGDIEFTESADLVGAATTPIPSPTTPVFRVRAGQSVIETLTQTANGNLGIMNTAPVAPLSFQSVLGNKIALWSSGTIYGLGIQNNVMQIFSGDANNDVAIGHGNSIGSAGFIDTLRVKGNGKVGIGNPIPQARLDVFGGDASTAIWGSSIVNNGNGVIGESNTGATAYGVWGKSTSGFAGYFSGKVEVTGNLSKGGGSFKIDHPLDPENKYLYHSFVESPDMMNIYNGNITTDANGDAAVTMPEWFEALNAEFRYQLTVMGQFAQAIVAEKMQGNTFKIKTNAPNVEVSWQVTGVRQDAFARKNRIPVEEAKPEEERGTYLHADAFKQDAEKSLDYRREQRHKKATGEDSAKPRQ